MGPIYQGQFHLVYHETCRDDVQQKDFQKPPLNKWGIPVRVDINSSGAKQ